MKTLGTLSFTRDTRAGYEIALVPEAGGIDIPLLTFCLTSPAFVLDATLKPTPFGSVASCYTGVFKASPEEVRNKRQIGCTLPDQ
jgi:hypothetical protein